jgi:hypothetical protein
MDGKYSAFISEISNDSMGSVQVSVWENEMGMPVNFFGAYGACREYSIDFSPNAEMLAISADFNCIQLHYSFEKEHTFFASFNVTDGWTKPPYVVWSPDGNALLLCMYEAALVELTELFSFQRLSKNFVCQADRKKLRWFTLDIAATRASAIETRAEEDDEDEDDFPDLEFWKFKEVAESEIDELWNDEEYEELISEIGPDDHKWEELPDIIKAKYAATFPSVSAKTLSKPFSWSDADKKFDTKKSPLFVNKEEDLNQNWYLPPAYPSGDNNLHWNIALQNGLVFSPKGRTGLDEELNFSIEGRLAWPLKWTDDRVLQVTESLEAFAAHPWLLELDFNKEALESWASSKGLKLSDDLNKTDR